jgi:methylated-DNA-[protein]-cysteine S-methyltransferase
MLYDIYDSPIGALTVATDGTRITALHIEGDRYFTRIPDTWKREPEVAVLKQAAQELQEYFAGARTVFDVPVTYTGTPFQSAVWGEIQRIPSGQTVSYSEIAANLHKSLAVRAVGTAVGRNPICIIIPCHRVLASGGGLGGYVAGMDRKKHLLDLEDV